MRLRVLQGVLALLVIYSLYSTGYRPKPVEPPSRRAPHKVRAAAPDAVPSGTPLEASSAPRRNLFEYGEAPLPPVRAYVEPMTPIGTPPATATPAAPVKLVGLVRQGDGLRAALALDGEIVLGAPGQKVSGYTIVSIDEDTGVVLNGPDGRTLELRP
jgi:hypothetical protein